MTRNATPRRHRSSAVTAAATITTAVAVAVAAAFTAGQGCGVHALMTSSGSTNISVRLSRHAALNLSRQRREPNPLMIQRRRTHLTCRGVFGVHTDDMTSGSSIQTRRGRIRNVLRAIKQRAFSTTDRRRRLLVFSALAVVVALFLSPSAASAASTFTAPIEQGAVAVAAAAATTVPAVSTAAVPTVAAVPAAGAVARAVPTIESLATSRVIAPRAEIALTTRLLYASAGGAAVGLERSSSDRPAGVRTMALVSLGAAAFTLCSMYGFLSVCALMGPDSAVKFDPSRMASNVASGVGFIGAGVITNNRKANGVYDRDSSVNGLTTAAAIWVSAAVGVASGVGLYFVATTAALSTIGILRFAKVKNSDWGKRVLKAGSKPSKKKKVTAAPALAAEAVSANMSPVVSPVSAQTTEVAKPTPVAGEYIAQHVRTNGGFATADELLDEIKAVEMEEHIHRTSTTQPAKELASLKVQPKKKESGPATDPLLEKYLWKVEEEAPAFSKKKKTSEIQHMKKKEEVTSPAIRNHHQERSHGSPNATDSLPHRHFLEEEEVLVRRKESRPSKSRERP